MKKIEIDPDWVLEKLTHTHFADCDGKVSVHADDAADTISIGMALDSLRIHYESYDHKDDHDDYEYGVDFRIEYLKDECPSFYQCLDKIENSNMVYNNLIQFKAKSR